MEREAMKNKIQAFVPEAEFPENKQYLEVLVSQEKLHATAQYLKADTELQFDYLFCLSGVDWGKCFGVTYHLTSTNYNHSVVLKVKTGDRENPAVDTVCDIWATAEFHEREVFDLFGVRFNNHPDLRRLLLPDDWTGYPLRKDFKDDINIISR